ncbi:hypothetical protein GNP81_06600 [Aliivibrio fischeri]|uniref:hypothetical protein n=1 Tax=Aliivibrio fischeri TaxID=668 RepID=UPI0012D8AF6F|nr:hypothetical protein [Aliivibrio fischeri]MUK62881.1 hypothetical protein [Aliivibrio fischeri]MUL20502.1 hypothetical protein [Aliivibrio fischeri]MUL24277.1 hypothetical protein [Aliivibrio fischeri]
MNISTEAFASFDFKLTPDPSPLDQLITESLENHIEINGPKSGALLPLPFQTGIGKTYTALNFLLQQMLDEVQNELKDAQSGNKSKRLLYYITDSVDNVVNAKADLLELIEKQTINGEPRFSAEQQEYLKSQMVHLPNQSEQLLQCSDAILNEILNGFDLNVDRDVKAEWNAISGLRHHASKPEVKVSLNRQAGYFYRNLIARLQKKQKGVDRVLLKGSLLTSVEALLPGEKIRNGSAHVIFLTTSKFLKGFHNTRARYSPLRDLSGALLIIDEIDKQNQVILSELCRQQAQDLIWAIRTLRANFREHQLESSPRYDKIEELFEPLRERLEEFGTKWNLAFAFNTEGPNLNERPVRLFSDRSFTHVSSATHKLSLKSDLLRQKNLIFNDEKIEGPLIGNNGLLTRFVNEADIIYQWFLGTMRKAVFQYWENVRSLEIEGRENRSLEGTFQEAVQSLLTHFNLQEFESAVYESFDTRGLRQSAGGKANKLSSSKSYHHTGLKLVEVAHNQGTRDTVNCKASFLNLSPSGVLADMVDAGAVILGISATARADTVIHNFDFKYLSERLGKKLLSLSREQKQRVNDYYHSKRNYKDNGVVLKVKYLNSRDAFLDNLLEEYKPEARSSHFILNHHLGIAESEQAFVRSWLSKLLASINAFISVPDNRYMLSLLNRNLDTTRQDINDFIQFCCDKWAKEFNVETKTFFCVNADWMRHIGYDEISNHLNTVAGKVVVFSTYASMGAGKNPDYEVNLALEGESLVSVANVTYSKQQRSDIDSIYLEKPTQLLLSDDYSHTANQLCQFHQILSLQENGELSPKSAESWCRQQLMGISRERSLQQYYQTSDYQSAVRKYVEQAVGRAGRTSLKRKQILLFADSGLKEILAEESRDTSLFSHEYVALVDKAKSANKSLVEDRVVRRLFNLAQRNNKDGMQSIKALVNRLHNQPASDSDIQEWQDIRTQLLRYPTVGFQPERFNRLYLQSMTKGYYRYQGNLDGDPNAFEFFDRVPAGYMVSEESCSLAKLVQNQYVKPWFELRGFACSWKEEDYVMTPVMFTNIYKGALGEQAVEAVLTAFDFIFEDVPNSIYERFDNRVKFAGVEQPIWLDSKYWKHEGNESIEDYSSKIALVEEEFGPSKFIYVNALGDVSKPIRYLNSYFIETSPPLAKIIEIPALIDGSNAETNLTSIQELIKWLHNS